VIETWRCLSRTSSPGTLTAPGWRVNSSGRILVESKDEIRKRLGRSTDVGDAVVMAFFAEGALRHLAHRPPRGPIQRYCFSPELRWVPGSS
jgi:hypothetical protein